MVIGAGFSFLVCQRHFQSRESTLITHPWAAPLLSSGLWPPVNSQWLVVGQETEASPSFLGRAMGIQDPSDENEKAWTSSVLHGGFQVFQVLAGRRRKEAKHEPR